MLGGINVRRWQHFLKEIKGEAGMRKRAVWIRNHVASVLNRRYDFA
jgi:hypothetical protein